MTRPVATDVLVIGAGAAGLFAALAARGVLAGTGLERPSGGPRPSVVLVDASRRIGKKILISGGGRCNVTNVSIRESDFGSGTKSVLRHTLAGFPSRSVRAFFESRGCPLLEEPNGKLFPRSGRAGDVLGVILECVHAAGVTMREGLDVVSLERESGHSIAVSRDGETIRARRAILATGGKSVPKTGSRGFAYAWGTDHGHSLVPPHPALTPIVLDGPSVLDDHAGLTMPSILTVTEGTAAPDALAGRRFRPVARAAGSLLVTHRGLSGPAALDVSGACARLIDAGHRPVLYVDVFGPSFLEPPFDVWRGLDKAPGACLPAPCPRPLSLAGFEAKCQRSSRTLMGVLSETLPKRLVHSIGRAYGLPLEDRTAEISGEAARKTFEAFCHLPLAVAGTDGFQKAEVTSGGIPLSELDRSTFESRIVHGVHLAGELLDVTGRLGGFNFQWAWSSGFRAGTGARERL